MLLLHSSLVFGEPLDSPVRAQFLQQQQRVITPFWVA
jgi:hypothetical protein